MEGNKKQTGSSSFTSDLFGPKHNPNDSSSSIFSSIFSPPNKGAGRESWNTSEYEKMKKNGSGNQSWTPKTGVPDKNSVGKEGQSQGSTDKSSYYQDQKIEPFHYSSSIYYGGQDVYTPPETAQNPVFATFSKDGEDDDSGHASRGNWWQGSLYY